MNMSYETACSVLVIRHKLLDLLDKCPDDQVPSVEALLARLRPYVPAATDLYMKNSDAEFAKVAKQLNAQLGPINDALQDIKNLEAGLQTAAQIISTIVAALGPVVGV
jgi:hypothetical protein